MIPPTWVEATLNRIPQTVLIVSTLLGSWLSMQAVHESGHVLVAWLTGGRVARVVLHPLAISRTDLTSNPRPLVVAWAGPIGGVMLPMLLWGFVARLRARWAFLARFFTGFCLIANGAYLGIGSFDRVGDAGDLIRLGSPVWLLGLFGVITVPLGLRLWHGQGQHFGLGKASGRVDSRIAYTSAFALVLLIVAELVLCGG